MEQLTLVELIQDLVETVGKTKADSLIKELLPNYTDYAYLQEVIEQTVQDYS